MVENFKKEELFEIIQFYKKKSSDIELSYLELQITNKQELEKQKIFYEGEIENWKNILSSQHKENLDNFKNKVELLSTELEKLKKKAKKTSNS
jgi:hypothetical protein